MSVKLGTLTLDLVARVSGFTQGMNQASTSAEREMRRVENSVVSASGAIKSLAATAAASFSVAQISNYADEFINLQNRLKLVTGSTQELTQATKDTYAIAQATAGSWDSTVQVYQRFAQNAKTLGINLSQVASLTDTVSKAIAISGGTAASSEAALVQFGQALSSGVLRGEEFNSIAEQAGGLRDAIARGLNLSAGDLRKWAADGKLTTDIVIKALQESKVSVDDLFNKTDFTGAQGFKKLSTAATLYIGDLSKSTGASKAMYDSLSYLSENLEKVTSVAAVGAAYLAGTYIPVIYKSVVAKKTKIASMIEEIQIENASIVQSQRKAQAELTAAQAEMTRARDSVIAAEMEVNADRAVIASEIQRMQATVAATNVEKAQEAQRLNNQITDVGRTQSITRMAQLQQVQATQVAELTALEAKLGATVVATSQQYTAARNVQASATARLTVATSELNVANAMTTRTSVGLMGALGGPVGLGLLVAGVAASMLLMRDNTNTATSALDLQKQSVDELAEAYSKMSMAKIIAEMDALKNKAQEAKNEANNALNSAYAVAPNVGNFGTEKQREQNKLLSDTIKELKAGSLDAAKALQELQKGGFTQDQLDKAQRYFATFEEQNNVLKTYNYQSVLTSSYLETASGLYDKTSDKISELTKSLSRLSETYEVSHAQILKGAEVFLQVAENSGKSKDQIDAGTIALQKYSERKIIATQLSQEFLKYNLIPKNQIDAFEKQVAQSDGYKKSVTGLNVELKKQNELRNEFQKQHQSVIAMKKAETQETNKQIEAQTKLNQKQQDALNAIKGDIAREAYIIANMKAGFSRDKSEFYADYRSKAELGYVGKSISSEESATVAAGYKLKQQNEARLASEKAIEASQKKQTKEAEKKYQYTQAEAKLLSKAYGDVSQSGLGAYAESRGIPANVIAGLYMQESKAGTDLTSHTGAKGNWQTTTGYREQNNISMADNNDFLKVGKIVVDNIAKVFADTGSLKQAVLSHNAGETGASNFMKDGRVKGSGVRNKEVAGYLPSIDKWASWGSGNKGELLGESDSGKDYQEFLDAQLKKKEAVKQLQSQFDTEAIQRSKERDEQINQAAILGQMDLIPKIWERYNKQEELSALQLEMDLNGYKWGEDQKIEYRRDISKLELEISGQYGKAETELRKNGIDALAQYEIKQHELKQAKELLEIQKTWMSASVYASQYYALVRQEILSSNSPESIKDAQLRSSSIDEEENRHATWNQYQNAIGVDTTLQDQLGERNTAIKDALDMQLITQEEHQASMLASEAKYYNAKAAMGLASAGTTMDGLAELTGAMLGEQNFLYKASFAAAKAFAVAKAIMNAPETFSNVYTSISAIPLIGPYIAPVMAGAAVAVQVAQASQIKSMQMSGFADGGYTGHGGKYEIGGVVHKGEGVLTQEEIAKLGGPSGFFALRDSIANGFADGGLVGVPSYTGGSRYLQNNPQTGVSITINNNTNAHVDARQNSDGTVTIDMVDQRIAQSWNKVRSGNSNESQSIQQAFGLSPTR